MRRSRSTSPTCRSSGLATTRCWAWRASTAGWWRDLRDSEFVVRAEARPGPGPGDPAPLIHTPTESDVGGDISLDRHPHPHDDPARRGLRGRVGKQPIVLTFATPLLCQSRVCGPVVDIAEQVKAEYGDKADFIHMEIYRDNEVAQGLRPQVRRAAAPLGALGLHDRQERQDRRPHRGRLQRGGAGGRGPKAIDRPSPPRRPRPPR